MNRFNDIQNRFCDISKSHFRKWNDIDVLYWKFGFNNAKDSSGVYYLNAYKDAYVRYNKDKIIAHANNAGIRPELLGGVAWIESGGMPENFKFQVFEAKRMLGAFGMSAEKTSFGSVAVQIRVAALTLGLDPSELTTRDQLELATCLMEDDFNLSITARHLRDLILYDYPYASTLYLSDEQFIMAGVRYNRGIQRKLSDFTQLINSKIAKGADEYSFISYGMRLLEIRPHIQKLLME